MKAFLQGGFVEQIEGPVEYDSGEENGPLLVSLILVIDILFYSATCGGIFYLVTRISERLSGG